MGRGKRHCNGMDYVTYHLSLVAPANYQDLHIDPLEFRTSCRGIWTVTAPGGTSRPFFLFCLGLIDVGSEESVIFSVEMATAYCRRPSNHLL